MKNQDHKLHILFASRLVKEKWVDILVSLIDYCNQDTFLKEKIFWHIASDGESLPIILSLAQQYDNSIEYHWKLDQLQLADLYRQADILFMPSRFLETFWLTALESLACGTSVVGIRKGWLIEFIPKQYDIDENNAILSSVRIFRNIIEDKLTVENLSIENYRKNIWLEHLNALFGRYESVALMHDYSDKIGGAEYYVDFLSQSLIESWYIASRLSYNWKTSPWKRRILFIFSLFAFWRYFQVKKFLSHVHPDAIWMHSILRYFWFWWVLAIKNYSKVAWVSIFLSHHDIWLIAPFPQNIYREQQIPKSTSLYHFVEWISLKMKCIALCKYFYVRIIKSAVPKNITHVIFSPFLSNSIQAHFPNDRAIVFPHTFDENIFHP